MFGFPLFVTPDKRNEIRFGIGLSGGLNQPAEGTSFLTLPLEISYVYHIKKHFTFQVGISVDIPLIFGSGGFLSMDIGGSPSDDEPSDKPSGFYPLITGFIGFRF